MFPGTESMSPRAAIQHMVTLAFASHAVRVMAEQGIADHLAAGPRSPAELAAASGAHAPTLARFLRTLAGLGLCVTEEDGRACNSPRGELLHADAPDSLRSFALAIAAPYIGRAWDRLSEAVCTGEATFPQVHGVAFWDYLSAHPAKGALFDEAMSGAVVTRAEALVGTVDLSTIWTLVDVGGGEGRLLAAALETNPDLHGLLLDRPEVLPRAEATMTAAGLHDRCTFVGGDFFTCVPGDGEAYVLAQILHDWPDAEATAILHQAMSPGARLWIVEQVIEPGDGFDRAKLLDLHMLVLFGAQERTAEEYATLLRAAGFEQITVHETATPWSIIEAIRG